MVRPKVPGQRVKPGVRERAAAKGERGNGRRKRRGGARLDYENRSEPRDRPALRLRLLPSLSSRQAPSVSRQKATVLSSPDATPLIKFIYTR